MALFCICTVVVLCSFFFHVICTPLHAERTRKGHLFYQKWYNKGMGLNLGAELPRTELFRCLPPPPVSRRAMLKNAFGPGWSLPSNLNKKNSQLRSNSSDRREKIKHGRSAALAFQVLKSRQLEMTLFYGKFKSQRVKYEKRAKKRSLGIGATLPG